MSGLIPTILLIVIFLILVLAMRMLGRLARPKPTHDTERDD